MQYAFVRHGCTRTREIMLQHGKGSHLSVNLLSTAGPVSLFVKGSRFSIPSLYYDMPLAIIEAGVLRCSSNPNRKSLLQMTPLFKR